MTTGNVSSLIGPGDDTRALQFTAPTQAGNSGGPLLDGDGAVVGVVSLKLNVIRVHEMTGDIPQNVNFAIKPALAREFLEAMEGPVPRAVPPALSLILPQKPAISYFKIEVGSKG